MQFRLTSLASSLILSSLTVLGMICFSSTSVQAQSTDFTFDTMPLGTASPLTMTQSGITATFTDDFGPQHAGYGPYDDGQFAVDSSDNAPVSPAFSGNILSAAAGESGQGHSLVILFSQPISAISFNFALTQQFVTPATLTFSAYNGTTSLGTETPLATPYQFGYFPEGIVNYSNPQGFSKIELSINPGSYYGFPPSLLIDNVEATEIAPVPEASTLASFGLLLTLGLGGLAVTLRRRQMLAAC